jgi:hypothetical protein
MERNVPVGEFIGDLISWIALGACGLLQFGIYAHVLGALVYRIKRHQELTPWRH